MMNLAGTDLSVDAIIPGQVDIPLLQQPFYCIYINLPMPGAQMSIVSYNGSVKAASGTELVKNVKIKSAGGGFQLKSLPTGTYLFKVTYAGYTHQESIVYINEGVLTQVEMPLTKIA